VKAEALRRPLSIDAVRDGGVYTLQVRSLPQTNLFLRVGRIDDVFVKVPSKQGREDYRKYVREGQPTVADVRPLEEAERYENLEPGLQRFPDLGTLARADRETAHYLIVHKLQHERLSKAQVVATPLTRFAAMRSGWLLSGLEPLIVQECIEGRTLWEMFDFETLDVVPECRPFLPSISRQLSALLDSTLVAHIDWNIKNFVFRERDERLFYVDVKPTTFVGRHGNEHNLKGIRDYFLV
jgi:hypothetical protein